jgi:DNA-binding transcriptional regulator GbsR (MarR family)
MCKASKYINEINSLISNLNSDINQLNQKRSEYDRLVSQHYHKIEHSNFNACEGFYLAKELQETLRKRRLIKEECERLTMLRNSIDQSQVEQKLCKTRKNINRLIQKSNNWKYKWKDTYTLEEIM